MHPSSILATAKIPPRIAAKCTMKVKSDSDWLVYRTEHYWILY